jgi:hypothetical protein
MPQPTAGQLHVDRYLTNMAVAWSQQQDNFVASKIFPTVPVLKESDLYAIYQKGYFYRDELAPRPLGGRPPRAGYEITNARYQCVEWGLEHTIDDRVRANADQPLSPDLAAMRLLTGQALVHRDQLWTKQYFTTGVWGTDWIGNTTASADGDLGTPNRFLQFDQTGSDPIGFFDQRRIDVASATGYAPNVIVLGADAFRVIKNHPSVVDRIKYTQRGIVTTEILAELFDVDRVVVPMGVINLAHEQAPAANPTDSINFILNRWSAMMVYAAPAPSINDPSGGYTFAYTGLIPGVTNAFGGVIERGREELAHSDVIQLRASYVMNIVASELGEFFQQCVSLAA